MGLVAAAVTAALVAAMAGPATDARAARADPPRAVSPEPVPDPRDRCPVCGMFVAKFPEWTAALRFADGTHAFFDGPKDLFKYLHDPARFGGAAAGVVAVVVTDYYTTRRIDAESASFVVGSDVLGPMGRELVPFAREHEALEFAGDHGAVTILRFADVTPAVVKALE